MQGVERDRRRHAYSLLDVAARAPVPWAFPSKQGWLAYKTGQDGRSKLAAWPPSKKSGKMVRPAPRL